MKRTTVLLMVLLFLVASIGCAKRVKKTELPSASEKETSVNEPAKKGKKSELPPAPKEGAPLAEPAEKIPISGGPTTPVRKALWQEPEKRPCWAITEGEGCPLNKPGYLAFLGISSGAAIKDGAILNAYQNAVEALAQYCYDRAKDKSPESRELARAKAYHAAGIDDKNYRLLEGSWVQKWEERYQDYMRVYFRAFARLAISEEEVKKLIP